MFTIRFENLIPQVNLSGIVYCSVSPNIAHLSQKSNSKSLTYNELSLVKNACVHNLYTNFFLKLLFMDNIRYYIYIYRNISELFALFSDLIILARNDNNYSSLLFAPVSQKIAPILIKTYSNWKWKRFKTIPSHWPESP